VPTAVRSEPLVTARSLVKRYGSVPVLDDVSFTVTPGVTGLLGANGAGKTTILGMILGLHPADGGELDVLGHNPWTAGHQVRARIGYAPEHHTLPPDLRAAEFVRHVAELHGLPPDEATTRASDALWLVDLGEERFRPMGTMSTGQRQRVKLAQAIAHDPEFVLLDEPTDGLDPTQRDVMLDLIRHISEDFGITVVLSSHLIDEVERVCDGAIIIGEGRTLAAGTIEELKGGGGVGVALELDASDEAIDRFVTELERLPGLTVEAHNRHLHVSRNDGVDSTTSSEVLAAVRDGCADHGIGIVRLERRRLRLEDVFLGSMR
jgi:ABC-2 type transport system ATP-binding protein